MHLISKKKLIYPISDLLRKYLRQYGRDVKTSLKYSELMEYENWLEESENINVNTIDYKNKQKELENYILPIIKEIL